MSRFSRSRRRLGAAALAAAMVGGAGGFLGLAGGAAEAAAVPVHVGMANLVCVAVAEVQAGVCLT